jgi:chaperonin GroES
MALIQLDRRITLTKDTIQAPNLTDRFSSHDLHTIGETVIRGYEQDLFSRSKWEQRNSAAMDLAMQVTKAKSWPWPNCANVVFPLVTIAALQFSARSYANIIQGTEVYRMRVVGQDPDGKKLNRALRIGRHMSWQVLEEDESWEEEHDRLLINLAIVGSAFVKTYFSGSLGHNVSEFVPARELVLNYWGKSLETIPRKSHIIFYHRNGIYEKIISNVFRDVRDDAWFNSVPQVNAAVLEERDTREGIYQPDPDQDTPFEFIEQHCLFDFDGDGYAEPYIITVAKESREVLRIVARFGENNVERTPSGKIRLIQAEEYFTKYSFIPSPDGGIYDLGFGTLLGPLNESVSTGINQILDAGTLANSNGGFLGRGVKIRGGSVTFAPWEWKKVDSTGDDLKKGIYPLPVREPSAVLFQLLSLLINYTDRVAGTTDPMMGENPGQNTPAETSRNMIQEGMRVYSSIFKRVWRSMKEEGKKIFKLNGIYMPSVVKFGAGDDEGLREDYQGGFEQVVPAADPNMVTDSMRVSQATMIAGRAHAIPGYNLVEAERRFLRAIRVEDIDTLYPGPDKVPPLPNPRVQVEEVKLKGRQMDIQHRSASMVLQLASLRKKNDAEIVLLQAQAAQIIAQIGEGRSEIAIKAFDSAISALQAHNDMINQNIQSLRQGDQNGAGTGVQGLAEQPGNGGLPPISSGMEGESQGAMGGGPAGA